MRSRDNMLLVRRSNQSVTCIHDLMPLRLCCSATAVVKQQAETEASVASLVADESVQIALATRKTVG